MDTVQTLTASIGATVVRRLKEARVRMLAQSVVKEHPAELCQEF
jgi:hypothetical protein